MESMELDEEVITRADLFTCLEWLFGSRLATVLVAAALFASYHLYQGLKGALHALQFELSCRAALLGLRSVWPLAIGLALINIYFELRSSGQETARSEKTSSFQPQGC